MQAGKGGLSLAYQGGGLVSVLFLESKSDDAWMNRATAKFGGLLHGKPGFCHVELCIPDGRQGYLSSSIYQNESVSLTASKTFANPGYVIRSFAVSADELRAIRSFVESSHASCVRFDGWGMMMASLPWHPYGRPQDRTFCSRYVTEALQAANIASVQKLNSATVTPTKLHKVLQAEIDARGVVGSVKHKQAAMENKAPSGIGGLIPTLGFGAERAKRYERLEQS